MDPTLDAALRRASYLYVTTYGASGRSGTVPVWCWYDGDAAYFTTQRESLKARRIRETGRVSVRVGSKAGLPFEGRAEWVDGRPDLETTLLRAYRRKYWLMVPLWMGRYIRRGLRDGRSVLVRITPVSRPAARASGATRDAPAPGSRRPFAGPTDCRDWSSWPSGSSRSSGDEHQEGEGPGGGR